MRSLGLAIFVFVFSFYASADTECTATAKCERGTATCSAKASSVAYPSGQVRYFSAECGTTGANYHSCKDYAPAADGFKEFLVEEFVCCTKGGTALSTKSPSDAAARCSHVQ